MLERDGSERSEKSISPSQTETDQPAFGTRDAKILGCEAQRHAWDRNTLALKPLMLEIGPPRLEKDRLRGVTTFPETYNAEIDRFSKDNPSLDHEDVRNAQSLFQQGVRSPFAEDRWAPATAQL